MLTVLQLIYQLIDLYTLLLIVYIIMSWLVSFQVINVRNRVVGMIWQALVRLTEPALGFFRRFIPPLGGIDISPILLFLALRFIQKLMVNNFGPAVMYF